MKRLAIPVGIVLVFLATAAAAAPGPRFTVIHITKNYNPTTDLPHPCRATVVTETFPSIQGDTITWVIRNGNAFNDDDVCKFTDKTLVTLKFKQQLFSSTTSLTLTPKTITIMVGGKPVQVLAFQETVDKGAMKGTYKYQVFYGPPANSVAIGPDPEVDVACGECGGGDGK
jgi:hypothetical protein